MKKFWLIVALATVSSGCDSVREILTGTPAEDADALVAAGPHHAAPPIADADDARGEGERDPAANDQRQASPLRLTSAAAEEAVPQAADSSSLQLPSLPPQVAAVQANAVALPPAANPGMAELPTAPAGSNVPGAGYGTGYSYAPADSFPKPSRPGEIVIGNATLKFVEDLSIAADVDGRITTMNVDEGAWVEEGQVLVELDSRLAEAEKMVADKELEAAIEKSRDRSEIEYAVAAEKVAQADLERGRELFEKNASNRPELDKKQLEARRAELAITVAELKNRQDVAAAGVTEAKQRMADVQIELRTIVAPFAGLVAKRDKKLSDWVRAGETILRLVAMDRMRVVGQLDSRYLTAPPHTLKGKPATIEIQIFPGHVQTVEATVDFVSPVQESSGIYKTWLEIRNPQTEGQWLFREGMPATVRIQTR